MKIDNFKFLEDFWSFRAKDRSLFLPRGVSPWVIVARDYSITFDLEGTTYSITVLKGLQTDLASVPWWGRWLVSKVGRHLEAAIIHDWLYGYHPSEGLASSMWTKELADTIFLEGMKASNVSRFKRFIIHRAVKFGGARSYKNGVNTLVEIPDYNLPGGFKISKY